MGMAASQARFLSLTARKSNVEYEGQQINQQRTTLSNQSANYYSELCNMIVPTPPSVDDYTKITYTFNDGALNNTITSMIARENGNYLISYIQQWQDDYSIVTAASSLIKAETDGSYKIGASTLRKLGSIPDGYEVEKDPYLRTLTDGDLASLMKQEESYTAMLQEYTTGKASSKGEWYVRYVANSTTGTYIPYFYNANDVENPDNYPDGYSQGTVKCYSLGTTTKTKEVLNREGIVEKDSSGRYIAVTIYENNEDGTVDKNKFVTYTLTTKTVTDEAAYNDAMNQYTYAQNQYDKRVQDINSKLEIVQQQDKTLELKLKQLDTEEQAINTEMDAVHKVLSGNVDKTFKTFNA